ncbi:unnamed protein product, partial [marine sediment metagenome]
MKSVRNRLLLTLLLGGLIGYIAACNNAKPTPDANAAQEKQPNQKAALNETMDSAPNDPADAPAQKQLQVAQAPAKLVAAAASTAPDNVPHPDPKFKGKIGETIRDSQADTGLFVPRSAPEGAPNVLLVLLDDAGFGASSTFGGPCNTPTLQKLADSGLRYNRFHTTAVCSPTRAALLTGHNHHST